ncbi:MAG TPA: LysM peptidoglycan-binding domain-containing protein [Ignavibacteria bacterium]|nr:LysM peptidoglycan-binding domain-containing protein [Ignavibacteria bacterium]
MQLKDTSKIKYFNSLPSAELTGSIPDNGHIKIYIEQAALSGIEHHLSSDKNNELGGVLTGYNCKLHSGESFIIIKNFIKAGFTNSSVSRLTFTYQTWEQINNELENKFPDEIILGWYHSHPGHSVFLSDYDVFIQKNFFNLEFMVAYVFDPTITQRGFFFWNGDKIEKAKGFYVINNEELVMNNEKSAERKTGNDLNELEKQIEVKPKNINNITILLLIINFAILSFLIYQVYSIKSNIENLAVNTLETEKLKSDYKYLNQKLEDHIIEGQLDNAGSIDYTVKDNDNIKGIAYFFLNDSSKYIDILSFNNLSDPNQVVKGMKLKIPVLK